MRRQMTIHSRIPTFVTKAAFAQVSYSRTGVQRQLQQADGGGSTVPSASFTESVVAVSTVDHLMQAIDRGTASIQIEAHLDLREHTGLNRDHALNKIPSTVKSIRGACTSAPSQQFAAKINETVLLELKEPQCILISSMPLLSREKETLHLADLFVPLMPSSSLRELPKPTLQLDTVDMLMTNVSIFGGEVAHCTSVYCGLYASRSNVALEGCAMKDFGTAGFVIDVLPGSAVALKNTDLTGNRGLKPINGVYDMYHQSFMSVASDFCGGLDTWDSHLSISSCKFDADNNSVVASRGTKTKYHLYVDSPESFQVCEIPAEGDCSTECQPGLVNSTSEIPDWAPFLSGEEEWAQYTEPIPNNAPVVQYDSLPPEPAFEERPTSDFTTGTQIMTSSHAGSPSDSNREKSAMNTTTFQVLVSLATALTLVAVGLGVGIGILLRKRRKEYANSQRFEDFEALRVVVAHNHVDIPSSGAATQGTLVPWAPQGNTSQRSSHLEVHRELHSSAPSSTQRAADDYQLPSSQLAESTESQDSNSEAQISAQSAQQQEDERGICRASSACKISVAVPAQKAVSSSGNGQQATRNAVSSSVNSTQQSAVRDSAQHGQRQQSERRKYATTQALEDSRRVQNLPARPPRRPPAECLRRLSPTQEPLDEASTSRNNPHFVASNEPSHVSSNSRAGAPGQHRNMKSSRPRAKESTSHKVQHAHQASTSAVAPDLPHDHNRASVSSASPAVDEQPNPKRRFRSNLVSSPDPVLGLQSANSGSQLGYAEGISVGGSSENEAEHGEGEFSSNWLSTKTDFAGMIEQIGDSDQFLGRYEVMLEEKPSLDASTRQGVLKYNCFDRKGLREEKLWLWIFHGCVFFDTELEYWRPKDRRLRAAIPGLVKWSTDQYIRNPRTFKGLTVRYFMIVKAPRSMTAIARKPGLDFHTAMQVGAQVAAELAELHRIGYVNRNVCADSIRQEADAKNAQLHFRVYGQKLRCKIGKAGILPKPNVHVAPEVMKAQALSKKILAHPSQDVYSMGVTVGEIVTKTPVSDWGHTHVSFQQVHAAAKAGHHLLWHGTLRDSIVKQLGNLLLPVLACLNKNPKKRPTAKQFCDSLYMLGRHGTLTESFACLFHVEDFAYTLNAATVTTVSTVEEAGVAFAVPCTSSGALEAPEVWLDVPELCNCVEAATLLKHTACAVSAAVSSSSSIDSPLIHSLAESSTATASGRLISSANVDATKSASDDFDATRTTCTASNSSRGTHTSTQMSLPVSQVASHTHITVRRFISAAYAFMNSSRSASMQDMHSLRSKDKISPPGSGSVKNVTLAKRLFAGK